MTQAAGDPAKSTSPAETVERLYREQSREIWAMFYTWCGDADRAWDAVQQAFLKLQEQDQATIHDPRSWLLQVGRNWLRDAARRRDSAWRAPQRERWDDLADRGLDPSATAGRADTLARVREAMQELRDDDREVLVLRYALGWPSQRIAETLGSSAAAIDMRLSRARQRLAVKLSEQGIDAESFG